MLTSKENQVRSDRHDGLLRNAPAKGIGRDVVKPEKIVEAGRECCRLNPNKSRFQQL